MHDEIPRRSAELKTFGINTIVFITLRDKSSLQTSLSLQQLHC